MVLSLRWRRRRGGAEEREGGKRGNGPGKEKERG